MIFIALLISLSLKAASANEKINAYLIENYPPYSWHENGQLKGIDVTILNELSARSEIDFQIKFGPWKRIFGGLKKGAFEVAAQAWWREERTQHVSYTNVATRYSTITVLARADTPMTITSPEDYHGKRIGKIRAFSISSQFDAQAKNQDFQLAEANTIEQGISLLENGRVDIFIHSTIPTEYYLLKSNKKALFKRVTLMNDNAEGTFLIFSKQYFKGREKQIISVLDKHLTNMHREGFIKNTIRMFTE